MIQPTFKRRPPTFPTTPRKQPSERTRATGAKPDPIVRARAGGGYRILRVPRLLDSED